MRFILITLISFSCFLTYGQDQMDAKTNHHERIPNEQVESLRIAFLTKELNLSPAEAQTFWPIYNEYSAKKKELKTLRKNKPNFEAIDDAQATKLLNELMQTKQSEIDLDNTYIKKFSDVLPAKKVMMIFYLERKFKEEILRQVKRRLNNNTK